MFIIIFLSWKDYKKIVFVLRFKMLKTQVFILNTTNWKFLTIFPFIKRLELISD